MIHNNKIKLNINNEPIFDKLNKDEIIPVYDGIKLHNVAKLLLPYLYLFRNNKPSKIELNKYLYLYFYF